MRKFSIYPGVYSIGAGTVTILNGAAISSFTLNTRDVFTTVGDDFLQVGPGSQVWIVGYSIRASRPFPFPVPANPLGLELEFLGSYDVVTPFFFGTEQRIILPVRGGGVRNYSGRVRAESPAVQWNLINNTGNDLEVSYQFWGKAL